MFDSTIALSLGDQAGLSLSTETAFLILRIRTGADRGHAGTYFSLCSGVSGSNQAKTDSLLVSVLLHALVNTPAVIFSCTR